MATPTISAAELLAGAALCGAVGLLLHWAFFVPAAGFAVAYLASMTAWALR